MSTSTSVIFGFDCTSNTQMLFAKPTIQLHLIIVKFLLMSLGGTEKKTTNKHWKVSLIYQFLFFIIPLTKLNLITLRLESKDIV